MDAALDGSGPHARASHPFPEPGISTELSSELRGALAIRAAALRAKLSELRRDPDGLAGIRVLGARLGGVLLAYAAQILAARYLGQEGFGIFALALVWLTLLGHLSVGGTNQALCRYVAQALATGDYATVRGLLFFGVLFALGAGALIGGAAIGLVTLVPGIVDANSIAPLALAFLAVPLLALQDNLEAIARAVNRPFLGIAPAYLVRHGASVLIFGALALSSVEASPAAAVGGAIGAILAGIAAQAILILAELRRLLPPGERHFAIGAWLRTALPIALVDTTELLLLNTDVLVVGFFFPPDILAAYFAATRITQVLELVRYSATAATAQRFAAFAAIGRKAELRALIDLVTKATTVFSVVGALFLSLAGPLLLTLFGPNFAPAAWRIPILASGTVIACLCGPGEDVLTMMGQERVCALSFALSLVANLALLFLLVPPFGLGGAAAATALTMACRSILLATYAYTRLGIALPLGLSGRQAHAA